MHIEVHMLALAITLTSFGESAAATNTATQLIEELRPCYTPQPLDTKGQPISRMTLNGFWSFSPSPIAGFEKVASMDETWNPIEVPGEWVMQEFDVPKGKSAGYWRTFGFPDAWHGMRIKLHFDAVYSECTVWLNGSKVGSHAGGFTPFELDVTHATKPGRNTIALSVVNESASDTLASGSKYAAHPLGGITRKVTLFAVPEIHISRLIIDAGLDNACKNGLLNTTLHVANRANDAVANMRVRGSLYSVQYDSNGKEERGDPIDVFGKDVTTLDCGTETIINLQSTIHNPSLWHSEHPHLYLLRTELEIAGKVTELVEKRFGFRKVELRGNQLLVNGKAVKLRGVCRHEVHPLRGRALAPDMWRDDALQFRNANVNFVRTSHYPPAEEFLDACDELGLFVEDEAPFCWAKNHSTDDLSRIVGQTLEMVERDRHHPSVIMWSTANECAWGQNFNLSSKAIRLEDPSRPQLFSYGAYEFRQLKKRKTGADIDIRSQHYPGPAGPATLERPDSPILFDEFCHLNAYNRHELTTDPGLRDAWGKGLAHMWELMYKNQGTLGGALWAAIDDTFFLPNGSAVGYGTWGPFDGWRRQKPEYWHMKKSYSPIRVSTRTLKAPTGGHPVRIQVENRFDFTSLDDCRVEWHLTDSPMVAGQTVKQLKHITNINIAPGTSGELLIATGKSDLKNKSLYLRFTDPRGVLVDEYLLAIDTPETDRIQQPAKQPLSLAQDDRTIEITCGRQSWAISKATGKITATKIGKKTILSGGPHLMMLAISGGKGQIVPDKIYAPHTSPCSDWQCKTVEAKQTENQIIISVTGSYKQAAGSYLLTFAETCCVTLAYDFRSTMKINPRQVGMVWVLPQSFDCLNWQRDAQWTLYPEDHIGRPSGRTQAFAGMHASGLAGPKTKPTWPWAKDGNTLGSNDFRSTKTNIRQVALTDNDGSGLCITSDGTQHARAWVAHERVHLLIADFNNAGGERFFRVHASHGDRPLKTSDQVTGCITMRFINN